MEEVIIAVQDGRVDVVDRLVKGGALDGWERPWQMILGSGETLLHEAVVSGSCEMFDWCMQFCEDVSMLNGQHQTMLHAAVDAGNAYAVEQLLKRHVSIELRDQQGYTALMYACQVEDSSMVKMLLQHGANPYGYEGDVIRPFTLACKHGRVESARAILRECDTRLVVAQNPYALHFAVMYEHEECALWLMSIGYTQTVMDLYGTSALHLAVNYGLHRVVDGLVLHASSVKGVNRQQETLLHKAVLSRDLGMIDKVVEMGVSLDYDNYNGDTALSLAYWKQYPGAVRRLVEAGSDPKRVRHWSGKLMETRAVTGSCLHTLQNAGLFRRYPLLAAMQK